MLITQKIIWEPHNCGIFLEKVYLRINENMHEISVKIVYERIFLLTAYVPMRAYITSQTDNGRIASFRMFHSIVTSQVFYATGHYISHDYNSEKHYGPKYHHQLL